MNGPQSLFLQAIELAGAGLCYDLGSRFPASTRRGILSPSDSGNSFSFRSALYVSL
mgnify:FL=1